MAKVDSAARGREIVFVDAAICDRDTLLAGLRSEADAILLSTDEPATKQIARELKSRGGVAAVHILAHGRPGEVSFAAGPLSLACGEDQAVALAAIGEAIAGDGRLLLWACNSGEGAPGAQFVAALRAATGAPVFAAKGKIGAAALGGSWELDVPRASVAAEPPLTAAGIAAYAAVMATPTTTVGTDTFDGTGPAGGTTNTSSADDTISVPEGTISAADSINGGNGTDTLNLTTTGDGSSVDFSSATISNVENLTSVNQGAGNGYNQTFTVSASQWAGFTTIDMNDGTDVLNVLASGSISLSGIPTVSDVETGNLTGTGSSDTVTLTGEQLDAIIIGSGTINLGGGIGGDTINLTTTSADLNTLGAANGSIAGVEFISASGAAAGVTITLSAQSEDFTITGSGQGDILTGGTGADTINAGGGADIITANSDADVISGGDGNDTINLANNDFASGESIDGGNDTDSIVLTNATTDDFSTGTVTNVETLTGSSGGDTITLTASQWAGFTTIDLAGGSDVLNVVASGSISASPLTTVSNVETGNLTGTGSNDTVTLSGEQLDRIIIGSGTIALAGGGSDTINLTSTSADLNTLGATNASITGVEFISASGAALGVTITLTGQSEAFTITGSAQGDILTGGTGADTISGGGGADIMTAGGGADIVSGGDGNDTINLANSNFASGESIDGGNDTNSIALTNATTVSFSTGTVTNVETLTGSGSDDAVTMSGAQWSGFSAIDLAGGGSDSLTVTVSGTTNISTGNAPVTTNTETVTLSGSGSGDTITISVAQFADFTAINLGGGTDTLNVNLSGTADISAGNAPTITNTENVNLVGSAGADTLTLTSAQFGKFTSVALAGDSDALVITTSANYTFVTPPVSFSGVESITLRDDGSGHTLNAAASTVATTFIGNDGADTMVGSILGDTFNLADGDFASGESITGGLGTDVIVLTGSGTIVDFSTGTLLTVESLTGSSDNDAVTMTALQYALFGSIDLGAGSADSLTINTSALFTFVAPLTSFTGVETIILNDDGVGHALTGSTTLATTFIGNGGADTMVGGSSGDTFNLANTDFAVGESITGGLGIDAIVLTSSGTTVDFTTGTLATVDTLTGSAGNDSVTLSASQFGLFSTIALGGGSSDTLTIKTSADFTFTAPATFTGVGTLIIDDDGNGHTLIGSSLTETINGNGGDDTIIGGGGADTLTGGAGNDSLTYDGADVSITGGADTDTLVVTGSATINLSSADQSGAGDLTDVTGFENVDAGGASVAVSLTGDGNANVLAGGSDADTIVGGGGADTLSGGAGNDSLTYDGADVSIAGGADTDTLVVTGAATIDLSSGDQSGGADTANVTGFENVDASGSSVAVSLTGDGNANVLTGGVGADTIAGNGGSDTLSGGAGNDSLTYDGADVSIAGGADTDTLVVTGAATIDLSSGDQSGGADTANVTGFENVDASGSSVAVSLTGGGNANVLTGGAGADTIAGNGGSDTLSGGAGNDSLTYDGADVSIAGGADTDTLVIIGGTATIDLSSGDQSGTGDLADVTGFENVDASGASVAVSLTGDGNANVLTGGAGADTIVGNGGSDSLSGGAGNDSLIYDGADVLIAGGADTDTLVVTGAATIDLSSGDQSGGGDTATVTGFENVDASGASVAVSLTGDGNANVLTGGSGADTITGGGGNDTTDGGGDTDTAVYSGSWTDYTITLDGATYTIVDNRGGSPDGTDTVTNVESFQFANGTFAAAQILNDQPTDIGLSAASVAEGATNGTVVGALSRTDADSALGDTASYSLIDGAGGRFAVSGSNLVVGDGGLLDFETTTSHSVTIRITDAHGLTYDEAFIIGVSNANEAPVIVSNGGGATASVSIAENGTAVTTVSASDADAGAALSYSLAGGADQSRFTINASGVLAFVAGPDFDVPGDAGGDNVYDVAVQVSDGLGGTDIQTLAVTVTNANEAPVIVSNGGGATASVNVAENSTAVTTVSASDADAGAVLTYAVVGGADQGKFTIDASGVLAFLAAPDFEAPGDADGDNIYGLVVQVSDGLGGTGLQTLAVTVSDVGGLSWSGTTGKDSGWGTVENDAMYGDAGKDSLNGLAGDDWLNGGGGADQLSGGLGSDTFVVDDRRDRVVELSDEGIDAIEAWVSYALSANVENLTLAGNAARGTGNQLDNLITGSSRANDLDGRAGADTLMGQSGKDTLCGGAGADMLLGGRGSDVFEFARTGDSRDAAIDTLGDFGGGDRIDLRQIDADSKLTGNQKFAFVGKNDFSGRGGGELNFVDGMLSADVNGDKIADFQVAIDVSKLVASDFFL